MLMTEEQARTKWCPKYQVCGEDGDNRPEAHRMEGSKWVRVPGSIASSACCVASGCMAWREESEDDFADRYSRWEGAGNLGPDVDRGPEPEPRGYCGAFGRPEA